MWYLLSGETTIPGISNATIATPNHDLVDRSAAKVLVKLPLFPLSKQRWPLRIAILLVPVNLHFPSRKGK